VVSGVVNGVELVLVRENIARPFSSIERGRALLTPARPEHLAFQLSNLPTLQQ